MSSLTALFHVLVFTLEIRLFLWLGLFQDFLFIGLVCWLFCCYCYLFVCFDIVDGVIFMISFSAWFLFVHNKTTDFCIFVLHFVKGIYMALGVLVGYLEPHI